MPFTVYGIVDCVRGENSPRSPPFLLCAFVLILYVGVSVLYVRVYALVSLFSVVLNFASFFYPFSKHIVTSSRNVLRPLVACK